MNRIQNIALVYWPKSREVKSDSQETIDNIKSAIEDLGYTCKPYRQSDPSFHLKFIQDMPDFAFNYAPGDYGEDGRLSGFFESVKIPYSNPGVYHHCVSMDKPTAKMLFKDKGVAVPNGRLVTRQEVLTNRALIEYPYILKVPDSGSSIDIFLIENERSKVFDEENCPFTDYALVEEFIPGREFSVAVFKGKAIGLVELAYEGGFFDSKRKKTKDPQVLDPDMPSDVKKEMLKTAEKCYAAVKGNSIARVDLKWDVEKNKIVVFEINTIPGLTKHSLVPLIAKKDLGWEFSRLIDEIIKDGFNYWEKKNAMEDERGKRGFY